MLGDPDMTLHRMQLEYEEYIKDRDTDYPEHRELKMPFAKKTSQTTYECTLDEVKAMFAEKLSVDVSTVSVHYVIEEVDTDPLDRFPGHKAVTKIRVTVNS